MPADETGLEFQEIPLGAGGLQHFGGVDADPVEQDGQLVHQRDVEVALGVFDNLGGFGDADGRGAVDAGGDDGFVERGDLVEGFGVVAGDDLEDPGEGVFPVAGVDAFGGVADVEILLPLHAGVFLQHGNADFLGGAGIDGGFVDHRGARLHVPAGGFRSTDERAEVGLVGNIDRRGHGDDHEVGLGEAARIDRTFEPRGGAQVFGGNLAGGVATFAVGGDLGFGKVKADGPELLAEFDGQRQADVAEADDGDGGCGVHELVILRTLPAPAGSGRSAGCRFG